MYTDGGDGEPKSAVQLQCWGDSLTEGAGGIPYPTQLEGLSDWRTSNHGRGGETSTQIRTRMIADTASHAHPTVIWAGRNNASDTATVLADIAAMVNALPHRNYLVLSVLNGDFGAEEHTGGPVWASITGINAQLATTYGERYIDIRSTVIARFDPALPQDVIDHGNDVPPGSLRVDGIHLNSTGYRIVAEAIHSRRSLLISPWPPRGSG